jgi:cytosine/adenosine deaminase-related metal-dependent hydrolase
MTETASLAACHDCRMHTHLGETRDEVAYCHEKSAGASSREVWWTTEPATAVSIRSPQRRAPSSRLCPAATATSATALYVQETGWLSISTLPDA